MEKTVKIINSAGMHARPASVFVKKANEFTSDITVACNGKEVNAKSIMGLMTIGAAQGTDLTIIASGADESMAVDALFELVNSGFGEE